MTTALILLAIQGALGAFDTLYYHEWKLRLPSRPHTRLELTLHASRDFAYTLLFATIGWLAWNGALAWLFVALLAAEIAITLWDFIEEDRIRTLPPGERAMHSIMGIIYGAFLAYLVPEVLRWAHLPSGFAPVSYGWLSWVLSAMAAGVFLSGVRDLASALRRPEIALSNPSPLQRGL
jgi:hypothetical protein